MELHRYTGPQNLVVGSYGILEPIGEAIQTYTSIDLIIVPGMAFDKQGHRLGRGKGYYDRLLPKIPQAYKIGICFPFQLLEEIPTEPFDICMDEILTLHTAD
ncbi:5-formyltetrahydrofolate cyclo-ligase [gut metagenome]|uniref:5-formyltetrahydrofolate cyclo-ligase n=1 Tax=gut metagenome TaxID=749906 RepID=J9FY17_9ZZZZ